MRTTIPVLSKKTATQSMNVGPVELAASVTINHATTKADPLTRQQMASVCVADWNVVHAAFGSFADEHSTL